MNYIKKVPFNIRKVKSKMKCKKCGFKNDIAIYYDLAKYGKKYFRVSKLIKETKDNLYDLDEVINSVGSDLEVITGSEDIVLDDIILYSENPEEFPDEKIKEIRGSVNYVGIHCTHCQEKI